MPPVKHYAAISDKIIEAVLCGYYQFASLEQAALQLAILKERYLVSQQKPAISTECVLWVRGFSVTDEEAMAGCLGHFVRVECIGRSDGFYGFAGYKIDIPLAHHPEHRRTAQRHPNWGHPVLRAVEKKRIYWTLSDAQAELQQLQQEYPYAAVPGPNKLYLMIFGRTQYKHEKKVKKYTLEIKPTEEGAFYIDCKLYVPKAKKPAALSAKSAPPIGKFTAQVALKKKKFPRNLHENA